MGPPTLPRYPYLLGNYPRPMDEGLPQLVSRARAGDEAAWEGLVALLQRVVWRVTGGFGLPTHDRSDVFAATFFRLFEHLNDIRDPERLPGWVATTARNEVHQLLRARARVDLRAEAGDDIPALTALPGDRLLDAELQAAVRAAFAQLGEACRELLRLVSAVPKMSYDDVAVALNIPRGSIGPTRQRCLERLRRAPELRPFLEGARP